MLKKIHAKNKNNGVREGCEHTCSHENTKITTNCWTTIDIKPLEPTKKDILHQKTKKKPQQDSKRGIIVIKSNLTPPGWAIHKLENNYIAEVLPKEWKFCASHQALQPGGLALGGGAPRASSCEGQRGLIAGIPHDWGKQQLHSWRVHTRSCGYQDPGEKAGTS